MKPFRWGPQKNARLPAELGISFERIVVTVENGELLDVLAHPNLRSCPRQHLLVVTCDGYVYLVPFVEESDHFVLKTIIPNRKATRDDLRRGSSDAET